MPADIQQAPRRPPHSFLLHLFEPIHPSISHSIMRGTIVLIGLAASSLAAPTVQFAGRASSCTYTCPGTNALGGKLLNSVLATAGVLQCTYVSGLTTGLCSYSTVRGFFCYE
jgi:hypothetical protein